MTVQVFIRKTKNFPKFLCHNFNLTWKWWLSGIAKRSAICIMFKRLPPIIWKIIGVNMGRHVYIGQDVYLDVDYADQLTLEDDVVLTSKVIVFCHRRDMHHYYKGGRYWDCTQVKRPVVIKRGACVGIGAMVMPGVTIGEGACIGAGAVVTKDIPAWSLAAGNPAKVIRMLDEKPLNDDTSNH